MKIKAKLLIWALLIITPAVHAIDIIAHRGASGHLPEHSLVAVAFAHAAGANFIEQDVVLSRDGVAIVLHDIHLDTTTDVAQKFPNRARSDGRYYAIDFDLAELKTLELHERVNHQNNQQVYATRFPVKYLGLRIPTLAEEIELIQGLNQSTGKTVGIYPEIKAPQWHRSQGQDISIIVLKVLNDYGYKAHNQPIYLQCFDAEELKRIRHQLGSKLKLVQLIGENDWQESATDYDRLKTSEGMSEIANYADGIGPWWRQLIDNQKQASAMVGFAKQHKLIIHPYTFRVDELPQWADSYHTWLTLFIDIVKVDGVFTDFPLQTLHIIEQNNTAKLTTKP